MSCGASSGCSEERERVAGRERRETHRVGIERGENVTGLRVDHVHFLRRRLRAARDGEEHGTVGVRREVDRVDRADGGLLLDANLPLESTGVRVEALNSEVLAISTADELRLFVQRDGMHDVPFVRKRKSIG